MGRMAFATVLKLVDRDRETITIRVADLDGEARAALVELAAALAD